MTVESPKRRGRDWTLSSEAFDRLLKLLDPDRERAGEAYERLRAKLTLLFRARGCASPTDLVDATFDRVAKILERDTGDIQDAVAYTYRVAKFIAQENYRKPQEDPIDESLENRYPVTQDADADTRERMDAALEYCLQRLPAEKRRMVLEYYQGEKKEKKEGRKRLAQSLEISMNALGLRAFHLRDELEACVTERLGVGA